jgi:hypothetical protein
MLRMAVFIGDVWITSVVRQQFLSQTTTAAQSEHRSFQQESSPYNDISSTSQAFPPIAHD